MPTLSQNACMTKIKNEIQIDGPANLLATVPYLLGFNPAKSLVIVAVKGNKDQVVVTMTLDLSEKIDGFEKDFLKKLKETIKRSGADGLVAIFYVEQNPFNYQILSETFMSEISTDFHVRDILWVCDSKWASFLCSDESCCPEQGRQLVIDENINSLSKTNKLVAGSKNEVQNFLKSTKINQDLVPFLSKFAKQKAKAQHQNSLEKWEGTQFKYLSAKKASQNLDIELAARLLFCLTDIPVRDGLLAHHIELAQISEDPHKYLINLAQNWAKIAVEAPETFRPPICTCIAAFMWQAGEGILARSAVNFALAQDPQFYLAKLLNSALDSGMPPWEFRDAFTKVTNPWS